MSTSFYTAICNGPDAKEKFLQGINKGVDVVASTQGYRGRTVMLTDKGLPKPSKDGFDVAESIFLEDSVESIAWETAKEACRKTATEAGDATTLTMVLLQAYFKHSLRELDKGKSAIDIKLQIEKSRDLIVEHLNKLSITDLTEKMVYDVANTSASGDEFIANLVADAFKKAGEYGSVGHTRSNTDETFVEHIEGTLVERGYVDERFVNVHSNQTVVFDNEPLILISNINFLTIKQIVPFLECAVRLKKELLIVSEMDFSVQDVILNNRIGDPKNGKMPLPFAVIQPPSNGKKRQELLSDLALICGCEMISSLSGADFKGREDIFLGMAKSITVTKENTIVVRHENTDVVPIDGKMKELTEYKKTCVHQLEIKNVEERIAKLSGGIAMIKVGGITPAEIEEKIARVDDAVRAVKSANEEGVLAGGGMALASFNYQNGDFADGITHSVLFAPLDKILSNAGKDRNVFTSEPRYPIGYDVKEFRECDMIEAGILDSTKAVINAVVNSVSASNNLLMTDNVVTLEQTKR
jgi:chaperonin GroEL